MDLPVFKSDVVELGIAAAAARHLTPVILVVPSKVSPELAAALLARSDVAGLVMPPESIDGISADGRVGQLREGEGDWRLPNVSARSIVLLGGSALLGGRRAWAAVRKGIGTAFHVDSLGLWHSIWMPRFVVFSGTRRLAERVARQIGLMPIYRLLTPGDFIRVPALRGWLKRRRPLSPDQFVSHRIVLANNSLAPGGAERQLVNTATGLAGRGFDVSVLCNDLCAEKGHDFYRARLPNNVQVHQLRRMTDNLLGGSVYENSLVRAELVACGLDQRIPGLPVWIRADLLDFAAEFIARRPQVVHLWQDYTNVVAGLAACSVGVPKIVLGMRNMAAFRFPYIQPFMRAAYKVLAAHPNVVLINNSDAGAVDYANWLGIPHTRFNVVRNGIDEYVMREATSSEVKAWRNRLALPDNVFVVGSVFRFYPEKQPLLWVKTAAAVARCRPDVVFLLVGWGPMQEEIKAYATQLGIIDRLFMPGPLKDIRSVVSCMNVFLLTSRIEGSPNVLLEAQMMGVPVVTTNAGGSAETLEQGRTGWVVARPNADDLAERILAILDDPAWATQARAAAPVRTTERFGLERMIGDTLRAYGLPPDGDRASRLVSG